MVDEIQGAPRVARARLSAARRAHAEQIVAFAWSELPADHRSLLESIGAHRWSVVDEPLASSVDQLLHSAGSSATRRQLDGLADAVGVWIEELRIMLLDAGHHALAGCDDATYEQMITRTAWHEWGHALSVTRAEPDDVAAGERLLTLAPPGIAEPIREAGYRRGDHTHELVAETYALLMRRRRLGRVGRPPWLAEEIYQLVRRLSAWTD